MSGVVRWRIALVAHDHKQAEFSDRATADFIRTSHILAEAYDHRPVDSSGLYST